MSDETKIDIESAYQEAVEQKCKAALEELNAVLTKYRVRIVTRQVVENGQPGPVQITVAPQ